MNITNVLLSKKNKNIEYIPRKELKDKTTVYSIALLNRIGKGENKELSLKIGRYKKEFKNGVYIKSKSLEENIPKSELTLDSEELENLVKYIDENYYPLLNDEKKYMSLTDDKLIELFNNNPENLKKIIQLSIEKGIELSDINKLIEIHDRENAIFEFEDNCKKNVTESVWQKWFQKNSWVFGNEFISINDDRRIDVENIADYIVKNFDGYISVIEIKRLSDSFNTFEVKEDHDNLVPSSNLIKAITQLNNYLLSLEKKCNQIDTTQRLGKILRPQGVLIYGSSRKWSEREFEAFRLLNTSLTNIRIYTYTMVWEKAKKMNDFLNKKDL